MTSSSTRVCTFFALLALLLAPFTAPSDAQQRTATGAPTVSSDLLDELRYRHIGPVGNRVSAVSGVVGDPTTFYAGSASGGIFKTTDAGLSWEPIFDDQPVHSIGSIAVAPSNPNIVWAGTGEAHIRSNVSVGQGIFKSTDAGETWQLMGLENTGRISRVVIHPNNPEVVWVASQGHGYGPQRERGIFRTRDGGRTWEHVLFVDENTGASDLVIDWSNPNVLYAGMWQWKMNTSNRESGGPGSGIFKSTDGGSTWQRLQGSELPTRPVGKIGLGISVSDPNVVYALIETGDGVPWHGQETDNGELWRSDDAGANWKLVSYDRNLGCRQAYYTRMGVSTDNPMEAYFMCASFSKTVDGGVTTTEITRQMVPGHDHHEIWIDPTNANSMVVAHDGGVSISRNRGENWTRVNLPNAQMYHVTVDNQVPYWVLGNKQDGPSYRGPSNSLLGNAGIPRGMWHSVGGGESGWATPDPVDPTLVWSSASGSGAVGGIVVRFNTENMQGHNVEVWPDRTGGTPAGELKYRFFWDFPLAISPHDRNRIYVGSQHVHTTTDGGRSWQVISPDLTLNDKSRLGISGGLTPDNIGVEYGGTLYSLIESKLEPGLLWTGSNDGQVHVTRDGGQNWTNVTRNIPGMPAWGTVTYIEPSRHTAGTAYMTVDAHKENDFDPHVFRTTDYGQSWTRIVDDVPRSMLSYAQAIREDPVRPGLLYLGTENALYISFDDGERWQPLQNNLPHAPVYSMQIQEHFNDLVVGTYGRGFWILDDITPLQQLTPQIEASSVHLFQPRQAYRFRQIASPQGIYRSMDDPTHGENPEYGASINYWLKSAPQGEVTVRILDGNGQVVRTLEGSKEVGINRIHWDLEGEPSKEARLRAKHLYGPDVTNEPEGSRPAPGASRISILMPPGTYTVQLSVDGQELSQPLVVLKDPNSEGSLQEIQTQIALLRELRSDLEEVVDMINEIEVVRSRIEAAQGSYTSAQARNAAALNQQLIELEDKLVPLRLTGRGQDGVRWPGGLAGKIGYLANGVASSDFAPTQQQREVAEMFRAQIREHKAEFDRLMRQQVPVMEDSPDRQEPLQDAAL